MRFLERGNRRRQVLYAEGHGCVDPEHATHGLRHVADCVLELVDLRDDALAAFKVGLPGLGNAQLPRRPVQQPDPESGFELGHVLADELGRAVQALGGFRKGAFGDDGRERPHAFECVHIINNSFIVIQ